MVVVWHSSEAGLPNLFSVWTLKFFAMDPSSDHFTWDLFICHLSFFCFSLFFTRKVQQFFHFSCKFVTCHIHLLFIPSLCICTSEFLCGPHVVALWTLLGSPALWGGFQQILCTYNVDGITIKYIDYYKNHHKNGTCIIKITLKGIMYYKNHS